MKEKWLKEIYCSVLKVQGALKRESGEDDVEVPPVPIPNTEVKLHCADDTWWATARESRYSPDIFSKNYIFLLSSVGRAYDC